MDALLLVDIQPDFLPGGALAVPGGYDVVPVANRLIEVAPTVVATQDWHPAGHASFASSHAGQAVGDVIELNNTPQVLWPDHCVQGTDGAEISHALDITGINAVVQKGTDPAVDSYSGFFDNQRAHKTELDDVLKSRGVRRVYVLGLATDYCVKFTALDAVDLGYEVLLVEDGCRGVDLTPGDVEAALQTLRDAGVEVITSDEAEQRLTAPILFYSNFDDYREFSNFYESHFGLKGKRWKSVEHYFQAQKFAGHSDEEEIRRMSTPALAKKAGRSRRRPFRKDWEKVKLDVMRDALRAKFTQDEELRRLLLSTGERTLVEHTARDAFWGDDGNGSGKNWLGRLLMELRQALRDNAEPAS